MTTLWRSHQRPLQDRVIYRRGPWRSFEAVEYGTLEWVEWFNHRQLLKPIENIPPAEVEEQYYAAADTIAGSVTLIQRPPANPARFNRLRR